MGEGFGFEGGPKGLHESVIVAVAPTTHALSDAAQGAQGAELHAGVLDASIRMEDMGIGVFRFQSELQRGGAKAGFEGVEEVPCDDFPGAKVEGEVTPARSSVDVSDIGYPNLIGPGRRLC